MDYLPQLEKCAAYLPYALYALYTFVFLTLLPKSLGKIRSFAAANYEANLQKYHRCYAPDICCHSLGTDMALTKAKPRKAVTRVYPKKQLAAVVESEGAPRRPVKATAPTQTNVNQIAKMFESGNATTTTAASKKINRVTPTILPEVRTANSASDIDLETHTKRAHPELQQEQLKNTANLAHQAAVEPAAEQQLRWNSDPMPMLQCSAASSATASPNSSPLASPIIRLSPLNIKSSLEDIFAAIARNAEINETFIHVGCSTLSPVTSIDDILAQRRLSRPLSAYSISDLLNEESGGGSSIGAEDTHLESFLCALNKT